MVMEYLEGQPLARVRRALASEGRRLHPATWVRVVCDVLSGLLYVATLLLYLRGRLAASLLAFTAALLSKVIVVTLPIVLLVLDWYPLRRRWSWRVALEKVPFLVLALAAGLTGVGRYEAGVAGAVTLRATAGISARVMAMSRRTSSSSISSAVAVRLACQSRNARRRWLPPRSISRTMVQYELNPSLRVSGMLAS